MTDDIHDDVCDLQDSDPICIFDSIVFAVGKPSKTKRTDCTGDRLGPCESCDEKSSSDLAAKNGQTNLFIFRD